MQTYITLQGFVRGSGRVAGAIRYLSVWFLLGQRAWANGLGKRLRQRAKQGVDARAWAQGLGETLGRKPRVELAKCHKNNGSFLILVCGLGLGHVRRSMADHVARLGGALTRS